MSVLSVEMASTAKLPRFDYIPGGDGLIVAVAW